VTNRLPRSLVRTEHLHARRTSEDAETRARPQSAVNRQKPLKRREDMEQCVRRWRTLAEAYDTLARLGGAADERGRQAPSPRDARTAGRRQR
jgi:hypothetical protein